MTSKTLGCLVVLVALLAVAPLGCRSSKNSDTDPSDFEKLSCGDTGEGDTTDLASNFDSYPGVDWEQTGPEKVYLLRLSDPATLRVTEVSAKFEADYFLLRKPDKPDTLLAHGDNTLVVDCLEPGDYYLVVDGRDASFGTYRFEVGCVSCEDGDSDPDGDAPDGDAPDGEAPDGDETPEDADEDVDECITCVTGVDCHWLGEEFVCHFGCCILVSPDGDEGEDSPVDADDDWEDDSDPDGDASVSCAPYTRRCVGDLLQTCTSMGTSWELTENCASSEKMCDRGECVPRCIEDDTRCDGDQVQKCTHAYSTTYWTYVSDCTDFDKVCVDGACQNSADGTWTDITTGLMWQNPPGSDSYLFGEAITHCENLTLAGYNDWRSPTIWEYRSLLRGCDATVTTGACPVDDSCLAMTCFADSCLGCTPSVCFWPEEIEGSCGWYLSASRTPDSEDHMWMLDFSLAYVAVGYIPGNGGKVRCVRAGD